MIPNDRLISVGFEELGEGPINIVTKSTQGICMNSLGIKKGYVVQKDNDQLVVENGLLYISLRDAKKWEPKKDFKDNLIAVEKIKENMIIVKDIVSSYAHYNGLGQLIEYVLEESLDGARVQIRKEELNLFARKVLPHLAKFVKAVRSESLQEIQRISKEIVGLGPGLTPSADDVLFGLMTTLALTGVNFRSKLKSFVRVNMAIISSISGRTTLISEEFLRHAALGEANDPIIDLVEKIFTTERNEVENATRKVLAYGETSGTDIILGILLGSRLFLGENSLYMN